MIFTGEYEHTIDTKHRLAIPADIRAMLEGTEHTNTFYLVPGANGTLWLWPENTFVLMANAMDQSLLPAEEMMEFEELLFSQASRLEMDKTGRIRLPERQIREAGLGTSVAARSLQVGDYLRIELVLLDVCDGNSSCHPFVAKRCREAEMNTCLTLRIQV